MSNKSSKKNGSAPRIFLPGMEQYVNPAEDEEYFWDNVKNEKYFDAASLPDSPGYQANAQGAQTYVMYVIFPSKEELERAVTAFTNGQRKALPPGSRLGSLNGVATMKSTGKMFLEWWEEKLLGIKPKVKKAVNVDEAQAPIG